MTNSHQDALGLISSARAGLGCIRGLAGEGDARDEHDPEVLNDAFRAVHSLAGVLPAELNFMAHVLCNRVDDFRMAKLPLTGTNLDQVDAGLDLLARRLETPAAIDEQALAVCESELAELGKQAQPRR